MMSFNVELLSSGEMQSNLAVSLMTLVEKE